MNTTDHGITCHCRKSTDYWDQYHATMNDPRSDEFKHPDGDDPTNPTKGEAIARLRHAMLVLDSYPDDGPVCKRKDCAEAVAELMRLAPIVTDWLMEDFE